MLVIIYKDDNVLNLSIKNYVIMKLNWTDVKDIAIELEDAHPDVDVTNIRFTDLFNYIVNLENFAGDPKKCNEKVLEAIQMAWLDERD